MAVKCERHRMSLFLLIVFKTNFNAHNKIVCENIKGLNMGNWSETCRQKKKQLNDM
jgi:hypothetical protein